MKNERIYQMVRGLEGLNTVETIAKKLGVSKRTAINYVYELRKAGFVKESRSARGKRVYEISPVRVRKTGGYPGLYETINRYSPVKVVESAKHVIYGKPLSIEEAFAIALSTGEFRTILAAVGMFKKMHDWSKLYMFAKKYGVGRHAGALYDLSRMYFRTARMDGRIRNRLKKSKVNSIYMIPNMKSKDFSNIEKGWKVFLPFDRGDMERYMKR